MIAGTPYLLADFRVMWRVMKQRAGKHATAEAVQLSRARNAVCLSTGEGVVTAALRPADGGRMRLFILMAVSTGTIGAFKRHEGHMLTVARDMGADELAFHSTRKGWTKLLGSEWSRTGNTFSRRT